MNRRRAIPILLASALILGLVAAAAAGVFAGGGSGSGPQAASTPTPSGDFGGGANANGSSQSRAPDQPDPHTLRHPHVPAKVRTHPRLKPSAGGRNSGFALSFRIRRDLGPHGHSSSYYGVIVSPVTGHPRHGCYGFGRYVRTGQKGQIARLTLDPRGRRWCPGTYEASVYLTGKPYCPPSRHPRACSTASYAARPTGWAYFSVH